MSTFSVLIPVLTPYGAMGQDSRALQREKAVPVPKHLNPCLPHSQKTVQGRKMDCFLMLLNVPEKIPLRKNVDYHYREGLSLKIKKKHTTI